MVLDCPLDLVAKGNYQRVLGQEELFSSSAPMSATLVRRIHMPNEIYSKVDNSHSSMLTVLSCPRQIGG